MMTIHLIVPRSDWRSLDDTALAWAATGTVFDFISAVDSPAEYLRRLAGVTPGQRALTTTWVCDAEIINGGFHQLFFNSAGILAPESVAGYELIGLHDAAMTVEKAMQFIAKGEFSLERRRRQKSLPDRKLHRDAWKRLDDAYSDAVDGRLNHMQADYIRAHPEEFFKTLL